MLKVTITNYSKFSCDGIHAFGDSYFRFGTGPGLLGVNDGLSSTPEEHIEPRDGMTTVKASQNMFGSLSTDNYDLGVAYQCNGLEFGVLCTSHSQVFGIGERPDWKVLAEGEWKDQDTSSAHVWTANNVKITATPDSDHSDLSISILVRDA